MSVDGDAVIGESVVESRPKSMSDSELTDEQLAAEAAREGSDGPAFVALVERFREPIWRVCYRLMGNAEDAQDAAQEVCVRLFLQRGRFQAQSKYSTWVHGVALRTCLGMRRGRGRRRVRESRAGEEELRRQRQGTSGSAETTLDLNQMLATLDEEDRALLILKFAEGHNYDELAEMSGLSPSACKMRISRAREKLKQRFPEHDFGDEE